LYGDEEEPMKEHPSHMKRVQDEQTLAAVAEAAKDVQPATGTEEV
jgi:hypothetical protein